MYTIIWQYEINPAYRSEFEELYGQNGEWVKLFRRSEQFIETEFLQCKEDEERYVTIDKWKSEEAYRTFKEAHLEDYRALDRKADNATNRESRIGSFFLL